MLYKFLGKKSSKDRVLNQEKKIHKVCPILSLSQWTTRGIDIILLHVSREDVTLLLLEVLKS